MSLQTQYRGTTHYIPGATCLDTKAIVTIEEGYNTPGVVDSYSEANHDALGKLNITGAVIGQSITGDGRKITKLSSYLHRTLSPTGNVTMSIYAHSGVFGTSSVPTGTPLLTSDGVDASTIATSVTLYDFSIPESSQIVLEYGVHYCITVNYDGDATNYISVGHDTTSPTHAGNKFYYLAGWNAQSSEDMVFYVYGDIAYTKIGDFKVEDVVSSGEQQQRVTLNLSHQLDYSNNHSHAISSEFKSSVNYHTNFLSELDFASDFQAYDGVTITTSGLAVHHTENQINKFTVLGKYNNLSDVRILLKAKRSSTATVNRAIMTLFRYSDESNYMFVRYDNNPAGTIILGDITWDGATARETKIFTKTGVSFTANTDYYMATIAHNDRVLHLGSTDGINYTTHFNVSNIYGASWASVPSFVNTEGMVGFATLGKTSGTWTIGDFQMCSLDDQYTYESGIRQIASASGIFGVSIENEFSDMATMVMKEGTSWSLSSNSATKMAVSGSAFWDTLMVEGGTFEDFVAECTVMGSSAALFGMCFGNTSDLVGYVKAFSATNDLVERYNNGSRQTVSGMGSFVYTESDKNFDYKMVKQGDALAWYINGLRTATFQGLSSGDILNSPGKVGVMTLGTTNFGATVIVTDFRISKLDTTIDSFTIDGNNNPRGMMDRFTPKGFAINPSDNGINVVEIGSSRGMFQVDSFIRNPNLIERYIRNPILASVHSDNYNSNVYTGISKIMIRVDDSNIVSQTDDNIHSYKNSYKIANDILQEENLGINNAQIDIKAIPTLELYDRVSVVDSTLGSSLIYTVSSMDKQFSLEGQFTQSLTLIEDGQ